MDEQRVIATYSLSREQSALLVAAIPGNYQLCPTSDVIDLIVTEAVCYIVNSEVMEQADTKLLQSYYAEVGEYASERIIWIGTQAPLEPLSTVFSCFSSFLDVLLSLETLLPVAWERYEKQRMYFSEYSLLPARAIGDYLEQEINCALHQTYGDTPDPAIVKRVRQEWTALLEVDGAAELAAAYELSLWLKKNGHPYSFATGDTASGFLPYLLGMTGINPLPPHLHCPKCHRVIWKPEYKDGFDIPDNLCEEDGSAMVADGHNLVWQEFCSYGRVPVYEFWLPTDLRETITAWLEGHWLQKLKPWEWENLQSNEPEYQRGCLAFRFELDRSDISPAFYTKAITADCQDELIRIAAHFCSDEGISRSNFSNAIALYALYEDSRLWNDCTKSLLQRGRHMPSELITCREDVYFYLKAHGFTDKDAFKGMNAVRKDRGFPVVTEEMRTAPDNGLLHQCEGMILLPSKAHLLSLLFFHLKAGRFKVSDHTQD